MQNCRSLQLVHKDEFRSLKLVPIPAKSLLICPANSLTFSQTLIYITLRSLHSCQNPPNPQKGGISLARSRLTGTTVFLFVSFRLLQRKDLRPQLTRAEPRPSSAW